MIDILGSYCGTAPDAATWYWRWNTDLFLVVLLILSAATFTRLPARRRSSGIVATIVLGIAFLSPLCALSVALFLFLGGLLSLFAQQHGVAAQGDRLFPTVVLEYLPAWVQLIFLLALISALFPSADGAITALTSSAVRQWNS